MSALAKLQAERVARDAAKAQLDTELAQVREDLAARGVGGRVVDTLVATATDMAFEAADLTREHKGVIAGTLAALILWFFRNPIIDWIEDRLDRR